MRQILVAFAILLLTLAGEAQPLNLYGNYSGDNGVPRTNVTMTLIRVAPRNLPATSSDYLQTVTDTNGNFEFTTTLPAVLYSLVAGDSTGTRWPIATWLGSPGSNTIWNLLDWNAVIPPNSQTNYFSKAQTLALLANTFTNASSLNLTNGQNTSLSTNPAGAIAVNVTGLGTAAFLSSTYINTNRGTQGIGYFDSIDQFTGSGNTIDVVDGGILGNWSIYGTFYGNGANITNLQAGNLVGLNTISNNGPTILSLTANTNGYAEMNVQNFSGGTNASSDWTATANNGSASSYYLNGGINGGSFTGTSFPAGADDAYLFAVGPANNASGNPTVNLFEGTAQTNSSEYWSVGNGGTQTNMQLSASGLTLNSGTFTGNGSGLSFNANSNSIYFDLGSTNAMFGIQQAWSFGNSANPAQSLGSVMYYLHTSNIYPVNVGNGSWITTLRTAPGQTYGVSGDSGQPICLVTNQIEIFNYGSTIIMQTNPAGSGPGFTIGRSIATQTHGGTNWGSVIIYGGTVQNADLTDANLFSLINCKNPTTGVGWITNLLTVGDAKLYSYNLLLTAGGAAIVNWNNVTADAGGDALGMIMTTFTTNTFTRCYISATEEFTNTGYVGQNQTPVGNFLSGAAFNFNACTFVQNQFAGPNITASNATLTLNGCSFQTQCSTNVYAVSNSVVNIWGYFPTNGARWDSTSTVNFHP